MYACAFVAILAFCFSSDYFNERAVHLAAASGLAVVSFAVTLGVLNNTGRYVLLCLGVAGVYAACEYPSGAARSVLYSSDTCAPQGPLVSIYVSNASMCSCPSSVVTRRPESAELTRARQSSSPLGKARNRPGDRKRPWEQCLDL